MLRFLRTALGGQRVAEFRRTVEQRGHALRAMSREHLLNLLASETTEHMLVQGRPAWLSVIIEPGPDESVLVVVQGFMKFRYLPGSDVALDGFRKQSDGQVVELAAKDLRLRLIAVPEGLGS